MIETMAPIPAPNNESPPFKEEYNFIKYRLVSPNDSGGAPQIHVKQNTSWSHCGPLLDVTSLPANLTDFADSALEGSILPHLSRLIAFANRFLSTHGFDHYLLTVRATTPNHEFDQPRWHTDDLFFSGATNPRDQFEASTDDEYITSSMAQPQTSWKICATLLGNHTLFIPLEKQIFAREQQCLARQAAATDHVCPTVRCIACASSADHVRKQLNSVMTKLDVESAMPNECTVFRVGRVTGAMHSEPSQSESCDGRVFVNIIPGTERELRDLTSRWGMPFPRQWWVKT